MIYKELDCFSLPLGLIIARRVLKCSLLLTYMCRYILSKTERDAHYLILHSSKSDTGLSPEGNLHGVFRIVGRAESVL